MPRAAETVCSPDRAVPRFSGQNLWDAVADGAVRSEDLRGGALRESLTCTPAASLAVADAPRWRPLQIQTPYASQRHPLAERSLPAVSEFTPVPATREPHRAQRAAEIDVLAAEVRALERQVANLKRTVRVQDAAMRVLARGLPR